MKRFLPYLAVVLILVGASGAYIYNSVKQQAEQVADAVANAEVDVTLKGVELSQGEGGRAKWRLKADDAEYAKDSGIVKLTKPQVTYFPEADGREDDVVVTASEGEVNQQNGNARLWPDVVIVSGPSTVYADQLDYDGKKREILLTGDVKLDRDGMRMYSKHLTMDLKTNDIVATKGVEAYLSTTSGSPKE